LVLNSKKIESTFKEVVNINKQYFDAISGIGASMLDSNSPAFIQVKYPMFNENFYTDLELDQKVVYKLINQHMQREGLAQSLQAF